MSALKNGMSPSTRSPRAIVPASAWPGHKEKMSAPESECPHGPRSGLSAWISVMMTGGGAPFSSDASERQTLQPTKYRAGLACPFLPSLLRFYGDRAIFPEMLVVGVGVSWEKQGNETLKLTDSFISSLPSM